MEQLQNDGKKKQMIFVKTLQKLLTQGLTHQAMN